jgi:hypothetical protein
VTHRTEINQSGEIPITCGLGRLRIPGRAHLSRGADDQSRAADSTAHARGCEGSSERMRTRSDRLGRCRGAIDYRSRLLTRVSETRVRYEAQQRDLWVTSWLPPRVDSTADRLGRYQGRAAPPNAYTPLRSGGSRAGEVSQQGASERSAPKVELFGGAAWRAGGLLAHRPVLWLGSAFRGSSFGPGRTLRPGPNVSADLLHLSQVAQAGGDAGMMRPAPSGMT